MIGLQTAFDVPQVSPLAAAGLFNSDPPAGFCFQAGFAQQAACRIRKVGSDANNDFVADFYAQTPAFEDETNSLRELQKHYTLGGRDEDFSNLLAQFPRLYFLLVRAVEQLRLVFGERKLLQLDLLKSDDDTVLRVMVKLPSDTEKPAELMRRFKKEWWLKNCSTSDASLVFDYEPAHGF